jgi:hypothetical protein
LQLTLAPTSIGKPTVKDVKSSKINATQAAVVYTKSGNLLLGEKLTDLMNVTGLLHFLMFASV